MMDQPARLVHTFEAGSYFEAMTIYYRYLGYHYAYTTDFAIDHEPYAESWAARQSGAKSN